ncbi:MAG: hypothetical protein VB916_07050 [Alphaproteobacteria bacterium]
MKIFIVLITYFILIFSSFGDEIDNKGLVCKYNTEIKNRPHEYYWFLDGQVYKVWYDINESIIKKSAYPAYYKITDNYIRFFRIFVLLNTLEFTDRNNNILGACTYIKNYENIEEILKKNLN